MTDFPKPIQIISFGFKYGQPTCNFVFDVSFLKNPARNEGKSLGGVVDLDMRKFVIDQPLTTEIIQCIVKTIHTVAKSGDRMRIAVGCSGGLHRSQIIAELVHETLIRDGYDSELLHRELGQC